MNAAYKIFLYIFFGSLIIGAIYGLLAHFGLLPNIPNISFFSSSTTTPDPTDYDSNNSNNLIQQQQRGGKRNKKSKSLKSKSKSTTMTTTGVYLLLGAVLVGYILSHFL